MLAAHLALLRCPACHDRLVETGALFCRGCGARYRFGGGVPHLLPDGGVLPRDRLWARVYDAFAPLHDLAVDVTLPLFQGGRVADQRQRSVEPLLLGELCRPEDGRPLRILDAGAGTGASVPFLLGALPAGLPVEIWLADISPNMLARAARAFPDEARFPRVVADLHHLPFADGTFDRVFHFGAVSTLGDARRALGELARVARPGTPVVVGDEQLDPMAAHALWYRAAFRVATFYDTDPHCPVEAVPARAYDVRPRQLSRFFYTLSFRV